MKSFLDRFRRKDGDEDPAHSEKPAASPAGSGKGKRAPKQESDYDKHTKTLDIAAGEEVPGFAPKLKVDPSQAPSKPDLKPDLTYAPPAPRETGAAAKPAAADDDLRLELGDFLGRIPQHLLVEGAHDPATPLLFDLGEIADRVAKGETTIPLTEIYARAPKIFRVEVLPSDNVEIRFPWQKVISMINDSAAATSGAGTGAAETLAQKLKSRRGGRRTPTGPAGTKPSSPAGGRGGPPGSRQVSWYSRPASETQKPGTLASIPFAARLARSQSPANAPDAGAAAATPTSSPQPAVAPPKMPDLAMPASVDDPRLPREELIRARDAAIHQLARLRGDYERQIALLTQERSVAFDYRDKAITEMEKHRKDIENQLEQIAFEKTLLSKTSEKTTRERELADEELATLRKDKAVLEAELEVLKKTPNPAPVVADPIETAPGPKESPRSLKEQKRQVEELQRRILALESNQKDRTIEIGKEKEARLKAERQLSAAERALQENAALTEKVRSEAKQQLEAELRRRDEEGGRVMQEQAKTFAAERDEALAKLHAAEAALAAGAAASAGATGWENRAVAQLEADIEGYRQRIKGMLQERDAVLHERDTLASKLSEAPHAGSEGDGVASHLKEELAAANAAREKLAAQLRETEEKLAAIQQAHQGSASAHLQTEAETSVRIASLEDQLAASHGRHETLTREKAEALALLEEAKSHRASEQTAAENNRAEGSAVVMRLRSENERLSKEREETQTEFDKQRVELDAMREQRRHEQDKSERERSAAQQSSERNTAQLRKTIDTQQKAIAALTKERDDFQGARDAAHGELGHAKAEQKKIAAELQTVRAEWEREHERLEADLVKSRADHSQASTALAKERDEHKAAKESHQNSLTRLAAEGAAEMVELKNSVGALTKERGDLIGACDAAHKDLSESRAKERSLSEELQNARLAAERRHEEFASEFAKLQSEHSDVAAALSGERQAHAASKEEHHTALSNLSKAAERTKADFNGERQKWAAEKQSLDAQLASHRADLDKAGKDHAAHHSAWARDKAELEQKLKATSSEHAEQIAASAAVVAELQSLKKSAQEKEGAAAKLAANNEKLLQKATKERDDLATELEKTAAESHRLAKLAAEREREVADLSAAREEAVQMLAALASEKANEKAAKERELSESKAGHARELSELSAKHEAAIHALHFGHKSQLSAKDEGLANAVAEHQRIAQEAALRREQAEQSHSANKQALIASHREEIAALAARHEKSAAELAAAKQQELESLAAEADQEISSICDERDRKVAELAAEKDAASQLHAAERAGLLARNDELTAMGEKHRQAIDSHAAERDELRKQIDANEKRLSAELRKIGSERDEARKESVSLIDRLTKIVGESEQVRENLEHERDGHLVEKRMLAAALDEARETHRSESATFSREYRAMLKQRDDALAELAQERTAIQQRAAALDREHAHLVASQNEAKVSAEKEIAKARRERDTLAQQRDDLRRRIAQLIHQQRQVLDEHASGAGSAPPPAPEAVKPESAPAISPAFEQVDEPVFAPPAARTPRVRTPRKSNVIDLQEAELVQEDKVKQNIPLPRVRPVTVAPPQVHTLG